MAAKKKSVAAAKTPAIETVTAAEPVGISNSLTIYEQLLACAQLDTPDFEGLKKAESVDFFIDRLLQKISSTDDKNWSALKKDGAAQMWFNAAVDAATAKTAIAPLPGLPSFEADAPAPDAPKPMSKGAMALAAVNAKRKAEKELRAKAEANGVPVPTKTEPAAPKGKAPKEAKPAKEAKAKAPKEPKAKAERKVREPKNGIVARLRRMVLADRNITVPQLLAKATAENVGEGKEIKKATVASVITDTLATYNIMTAMGLVKE